MVDSGMVISQCTFSFWLTLLLTHQTVMITVTFVGLFAQFLRNFFLLFRSKVNIIRVLCSLKGNLMINCVFGCLFIPDRGYMVWGVVRSLDIWHAAKNMTRRLHSVRVVKTLLVICCLFQQLVVFCFLFWLVFLKVRLSL